MISDNFDSVEVKGGHDARAVFPGYYPPSEDERRDAFQHGLVSLDTNALLDLYRFTPKARDELFSVLDSMKPRLFLTHQVVYEFHENRLKIVDESLNAATKEHQEIENLLKQVTDRIAAFARRYQISEDDRETLANNVATLGTTIGDALHLASASDIDRVAVKAAIDPVLIRLDEVSRGRVGSPLSASDYQAALEEAAKRRANRIPPGYMDDKKDSPVRQSGDYLVWRQLLNEAKNHKRCVLFVCNEDKEDWVRKYRGETLGPRPELVLEMQQEAGSSLHVVNVVGLLLNARKYLGSEVSDSTVAEATVLPEMIDVEIIFSPRAQRDLSKLSQEDKELFELALGMLESDLRLRRHQMPRDMLKRTVGGAYDDGISILRWSRLGRAVVRIVRPDLTFHGVRILVSRIEHKRASGADLVED